MNGTRYRRSRPEGTPAFRTLGATTAWSAEEAEQVLAFLDALREELWRHYGEDIVRAHHEQACLDAQHELPFDDPPF